jgi:hypothetical protein
LSGAEVSLEEWLWASAFDFFILRAGNFPARFA